MFEPVNSRVDFAAMERETIDWWNEHSIPLKYRLRNRESERTYSFIDGPITANNPMGVHHAWGRSYKDLFLRFRNMQGYRQRFQNGFDGQGLWIEVEVEKELGFARRSATSKGSASANSSICARLASTASPTSSPTSPRGSDTGWTGTTPTTQSPTRITTASGISSRPASDKGLIYKGTDVMPWCPSVQHRTCRSTRSSPRATLRSRTPGCSSSSPWSTWRVSLSSSGRPPLGRCRPTLRRPSTLT